MSTKILHYFLALKNAYRHNGTMKLKLKKYLQAPEYVIHVFGNANRAAIALGRTRQSVYKWRDIGRIPMPAIYEILEKATELNLPITLDDLINGRMVKK